MNKKSYNFFLLCSSQASSCCRECMPVNNVTLVCLKGDSEFMDGGCQNDTYCEMNNPDCPAPTPQPNSTVCNNGSNVCENGACTGLDTTCALEQWLNVFGNLSNASI